MDTYNFESKHLYRKRRETAIDKLVNKPPWLRSVAYLDTKEALDTISYIKRGYDPKKMWAVNNNPAEVALLSKKLDSLNLPRVNTVGLDFEDALNRRIPDVDIIDFDGMGNINNNVSFMLQKITSSRPKAVMGVTVLAGREQDNIFRVMIKNLHVEKVHTSYGTPIKSKHGARLFVLLNSILCGQPIKATKTYKKKWQ